MTPDIDNIATERSGSHPLALATSGVCTCVAVVVLLRGGDVFMAHVDPTKIVENSSSINVGAQVFVEHCIRLLSTTKPGVAIDGVFLIGGCDSRSYHQVSQWIERARTSSSLAARSTRVSTDQLYDFLRKIKVNLLTFNIRTIRHNSAAAAGNDNAIGSDSPDDYVTDYVVVYDQALKPATFIIAQRAGKEKELTGNTTLTSPFAIYKIDVASSKILTVTYPPLYRSEFSSVLVEAVRRNTANRLSVFHRGFDLPEDNEQRMLLSRVKKPAFDYSFNM